MIRFMKKDTNKGFTLIEMILSMMVFSISILLLSSCLRIIHSLSKTHYPIEEEIALKQLRTMISLSSDIVYQNDALEFYYLGKQGGLYIEQDRLVRKDGYVIYLNGLKNAGFIKKGACYFIRYERENKQHERFLGCQ